MYDKCINSDVCRKIEVVTSQNSLHQEINEPTHILNNSSWYIDLVFNFQPNLLIASGVHPSLHPSCHHQMIFAKFKLDIVYPPHYEREIWHYQKVNIDLIKRATNSFDWEKAFSNIHVDEMVCIFIKLISIYYVILFPMRRSCLMTEILLGWTGKWKNCFMKRNSFFSGKYVETSDTTDTDLKHLQDFLFRYSNDKKCFDEIRPVSNQPTHSLLPLRHINPSHWKN